MLLVYEVDVAERFRRRGVATALLRELERLARERAGEDPVRDEEWGFLFMHLREFAGPDGTLPVDFDGLVRDAFGDLIGTRDAR